MEKKKTTELPGMPTRTGAGKAALEFVNLRHELGEIQESLDKKGEEFRIAMKSENRLSIIIEDGESNKYTLSTTKVERVTCRKMTAIKIESKGD